MNSPRDTSRPRAACRKAARLRGYLATGLGASTLATSAVEAAIIVLDVGPGGFNIEGVNAGVAPGGMQMIPFPTASQYWLGLFNDYTNGYFALLGIGMGPQAGVAFTGGAVRPQNFASPRNFALGEIIDASATFTSGFYEPMFRVQSPNLLYLAPDFGPASYLGFRSSGGSYGWLEVTWDQATAEFEILAAAYETQVGVGIAAGAVPEPPVSALAALALGGAAYARWRRCRAQDLARGPARPNPLTAGS
jgi:hypothetical protein